MEKFAESLGLPGTPKIKFLSREQTKGRKNASRAVAALRAQIDSEKSDHEAFVEECASSSGSDETESAESSEQEQDEELSLKAAEPAKVCSISFLDSVIVYLVVNTIVFRSYEI